eukprot:3022273-Prymnesium_polylepis.1
MHAEDTGSPAACLVVRIWCVWFCGVRLSAPFSHLCTALVPPPRSAVVHAPVGGLGHHSDGVWRRVYHQVGGKLAGFRITF